MIVLQGTKVLEEKLQNYFKCIRHKIC